MHDEQRGGESAAWLGPGRKAWLFADSNRGGQRAAFFNSLIVTAKLNDVDPQAWQADVLGRIASHPAQRLTELLPWNWRPILAETPGLDAVVWSGKIGKMDCDIQRD